MEHVDHGEEAIRLIDDCLKTEEAKLAALKDWLQKEFEEEQFVFGWAHNIVDTKDVGDYGTAA